MKRATDLHTILADYIHIQTGYVLIFLCAYVVEEKKGYQRNESTFKDLIRNSFKNKNWKREILFFRDDIDYFAKKKIWLLLCPGV